VKKLILKKNHEEQKNNTKIGEKEENETAETETEEYL